LFENSILTYAVRSQRKLNIYCKPIAHKYCEGKVKRTQKRELKVPEIVKRKEKKKKKMKGEKEEKKYKQQKRR